jgi:hypothetical protein
MEFVRNLATEQRKRLVGSLMEHIERQVYPHLPREAQVALRQKVLQCVGAYHDFVLDCLKASVNDGSVTNDAALELLTKVHDGQAALRRDVTALLAD